MMEIWQNHGFDLAWRPTGANQHKLSENCIEDPANISIVGVIAVDTAELGRMGMVVRVSDGRLAMVSDEETGSSSNAA